MKKHTRTFTIEKDISRWLDKTYGLGNVSRNVNAILRAVKEERIIANKIYLEGKK